MNSDSTKKYYDSNLINKGLLRKKYAFLTQNKTEITGYLIII